MVVGCLIIFSGYQLSNQHKLMGIGNENKDEQNRAELEKLKAETAFIKLQAGNCTRQNRLEAIKSLGTFITAIVALFGLFFTYNQQRSQLEQIAKQHLDEDFTKDVQQFSSVATDASKVVSIAKLATNFQPQYAQYHSQLINLVAGPDKEDKGLCPQLVSSQLADRLEFDGVTFSQSGLCGLSFANYRFQDVNLDESILIGTHFITARFRAPPPPGTLPGMLASK
jgi:hypothetical protein